MVDGSSDRGLRFLRLCTYVIVVIAGLKAAAALLLPIVVAALVCIACTPLMRRLRRWGIPTLISIGLVVGFLLFTLSLVSGLAARSIQEFRGRMDDYEERLDTLFEGALSAMGRFGLDLSSKDFSSVVSPDALMRVSAEVANATLSLASNLFVILLITVFMMTETFGLPSKIRYALGDPEADLSEYDRVASHIYGYLGVKTAVSLFTGVLAWGLVMVADVDFPLLWGLLAFLLNFIPTIGSFIAAVPPVLLALIQYGPRTALIIIFGYTAINIVIGNVVEPKVMGKRLGLSPLVVVLSLLFWNWVWGPVGMLLSLPLTMVVKILMEQSDDLRTVARLLEPSQS